MLGMRSHGLIGRSKRRCRVRPRRRIHMTWIGEGRISGRIQGSLFELVKSWPHFQFWTTAPRLCASYGKHIACTHPGRGGRFRSSGSTSRWYLDWSALSIEATSGAPPLRQVRYASLASIPMASATSWTQFRT
jgi:hypothetical protein